jgi:methionyl-tRNA formyltransferase
VALDDAGHDVTLVISGPDRRRTRRGEPTPSPVKAAALARGLSVSDRVADVSDSGSELGVVVAFGRLIPAGVLDLLPFVNLHLSILPRWRGAAPVERAILAGDQESGVSIMALDVGLDTGDVYDTITTPIEPAETASALGSRLVDLGTRALIDRLRDGLGGLGEARPQVGAATYAEKLTARDRVVDFDEPAEVCNRVVRIGRASSIFRGEPLIIHRAEVVLEVPAPPQAPGTLVGDVVATGLGGLRLIEVQAAGRRVQPFAEFARGARVVDGEMLVAPTAAGPPPG